MRQTTFTLLAVAVICAAVASAQNPDSAFPVTQGSVYKFQKIADGIYYATGGFGANHPIFVGERDVILVDTGSTPESTRELLKDMKLITDKPVATLISTHFHYDHTFGNQAIPPNTQMIAHEYVRRAMLTFNVLESEPYRTSQKTRIAGLMQSVPKQIAGETDPAKKTALQKQLTDTQTQAKQFEEVQPVAPNVTYSTKMTIFQGQREIQLLYLGHAHTGGDTFIYLPAEKIICTGDVAQSQVAYMGDGIFDEWITTLEKLKGMDFNVALPGHGAILMDKSKITGFQGYLKDLTTQIAELKKQGVSPEDAAKRVDLTAWQKYFPNIRGPGADIRGVRRVYDWMDGHER